MWKCVKCNEQLEDTFNVCWSCGTSKDGVEDPEFTREEGWDQPVAVDVREADAKPTSALPPPLVVSTCPKCGEKQIRREIRRDGSGWRMGDKILDCVASSQATEHGPKADPSDCH